MTRPRVLLAAITVTLTLAGIAHARPRMQVSAAKLSISPRNASRVTPIAAPAALLRARQACPNQATVVQCRSALRRAYAAIEWQQQQQLALARLLVGNVGNWTCLHSKEGAWNDAGDPYWGGLQMDRTFMRTYGRDMIRRHHGGLANTWTPREQIIVAQRAFAQGRGYNPWPVTGRACGLVTS